jgi:hypothetical protein
MPWNERPTRSKAKPLATAARMEPRVNDTTAVMRIGLRPKMSDAREKTG